MDSDLEFPNISKMVSIIKKEDIVSRISNYETLKFDKSILDYETVFNLIYKDTEEFRQFLIPMFKLAYPIRIEDAIPHIKEPSQIMESLEEHVRKSNNWADQENVKQLNGFFDTLKEIQRYSKSFFSDSLPNKEELGRLQVTIDVMIESAKGDINSMDITDMASRIARIHSYYSLMSCELIRQVNINCSQRAQFMLKIHKFGGFLYQCILTHFDRIFKKSNQFYTDGINTLTENFNHTSKIYAKKLVELELETSLQKKKLDHQDKYINQLEFTNRDLKETISNGQAFVKFLRERFSHIKTQRRELALKLVVSKLLDLKNLIIKV